jgi:formylglycine-generating enzyme required for sulfatase activity
MFEHWNPMVTFPPSRRWLRTTLLSLLVIGLANAQGRPKRVAPIDGSLRESFQGASKVAILAGIGAYPQASGLGSLKYPSQDVTLLAGELEKQGYMVRRLVDSDATRGSIRRTIAELAHSLNPGRSTFLFYFSGHGFEQDGKNYLATYGASTIDLVADGLAVADVETMLRNSGAQQVMMLIDACRNDPALGARSASQRSFTTLAGSRGIRTLYSTSAGHLSYESDDLKQGVFTYFLVKGLKGEAAGPDGLITFEDLSGYVGEKVSAWGSQSGLTQASFETGESSGDFLIGRRIAAPAPKFKSSPIREKVNPADGLTYSWIPPGKFRMGCSDGDEQCREDEFPARVVTISKGFWMSETTATVKTWRKYRLATGTPALPASVLLFDKLNEASGDENKPAVQMTWEQARHYCEWSGGRLPTEAEWEYSSRAGSLGARYETLDDIAWTADNSGRKPIDSESEKRRLDFGGRWLLALLENKTDSHAVRQKQPNLWNLFDMLGNVKQWTSDWYGANSYQSSGNVDPAGPLNGTYKAIRGGSWFHTPSFVRVSARFANKVEGDADVGVRCVSD